MPNSADARCSRLYDKLSTALDHMVEVQDAHAALVRLLVGPNVDLNDPSGAWRAIMAKHGADDALIEAVAHADRAKVADLFPLADMKASVDDVERVIESGQRGRDALQAMLSILAEAQQVLDANPPTGGSTP
jgi:hypothetical protein